MKSVFTFLLCSINPSIHIIKSGNYSTAVIVSSNLEPLEKSSIECWLIFVSAKRNSTIANCQASLYPKGLFEIPLCTQVVGQIKSKGKRKLYVPLKQFPSLAITHNPICFNNLQTLISAMASLKAFTANFVKLDRFDGANFRRWQKKLQFLPTNLKVVYVLTTPKPEESD